MQNYIKANELIEPEKENKMNFRFKEPLPA
jgi:hypothetical protein